MLLCPKLFVSDLYFFAKEVKYNGGLPWWWQVCLVGSDSDSSDNGF